MSLVTDVTVVFPAGSRDSQRFQALIKEHRGYDPHPAESSDHCTGASVFTIGMDYASVETLDAILDGPWSAGTVVCIEQEWDTRPRVKVFGPEPTGGWDSPPEHERY